MPFKNHPELLKKLGLELGEWFVLTTVASSPIPFDEVPQKTAALSDGDPRGRINVKDARMALRLCVSNGLVTKVTNHYLSLIRWFLDREGGVGPIYGLPNVGDADFTPEGVNKFTGAIQRLHPDLEEHEEFEIYNGKRRFIVPNQTTAHEIAAHHKGSRVEKIGPWRVYWWKAYPHGYVISTR